MLTNTLSHALLTHLVPLSLVHLENISKSATMLFTPLLTPKPCSPSPLAPPINFVCLHFSFDIYKTYFVHIYLTDKHKTHRNLPLLYYNQSRQRRWTLTGCTSFCPCQHKPALCTLLQQQRNSACSRHSWGRRQCPHWHPQCRNPQPRCTHSSYFPACSAKT